MRKFVLVLPVLLMIGFVLSGCDNGNKDEDENKEETIKGFTVTITGLPALPQEQGTLYGYGASLMVPPDITNPVAVGLPNSGVFEFFLPSQGSKFPSTEPFITPGDYLLLIAVIDLLDITNPDIEPKEIYAYTGGTQRVSFSNTKKNIPLAWEGNFNKVQQP